MVIWTLVPLILILLVTVYERIQDYRHLRKNHDAFVAYNFVPGTNWKFVPSVEGTPRPNPDKYLRMMVPLLTFLLPMIATEIGNGLIVCDSFTDGNGNDMEFARADNRIECKSDLFLKTRVYASVMFFVCDPNPCAQPPTLNLIFTLTQRYFNPTRIDPLDPIGIPIAFFIMMFKTRHR